MHFGIDTFATKTFAKQEGAGFQFWNEICPAGTTWSIINPKIIGIRRCTDGS